MSLLPADKTAFLSSFNRDTILIEYMRKSRKSYVNGDPNNIDNSNTQMIECIEAMFYNIYYYIFLNDNLVADALKERRSIMILNSDYLTDELTCTHNNSILSSIRSNYLFGGNLMQDMKNINEHIGHNGYNGYYNGNRKLYHESIIDIIKPIYKLPVCTIRCVYSCKHGRHRMKIYIERSQNKLMRKIVSSIDRIFS
jgi:hypothetical protein